MTDVRLEPLSCSEGCGGTYKDNGIGLVECVQCGNVVSLSDFQLDEGESLRFYTVLFVAIPQ